MSWRCEASAAAGEAEGQHNLAHMCLSGIGAPADEVKAKEWLARAAAGGHGAAQAKLRELERAAEAPRPTERACLVFEPVD
mmetsp:Transcript_124184/g.386723  ORF Transcript_124184/g.386723 Transcript_124184/m.386723 type:complete len:81 (-) Transcript_124184:95-337(-)